MTDRDNPRHRPTVRLIVVDELNRLLLFRGISQIHHDRYWFTPGGGIEPGESIETAARREMHEETGLIEFDLGPEIWHRDNVIHLNGEWIWLEEWAHLIRVAAFEVDTSGFTQLEIDTITEHRWWTHDELIICPDRLSPQDLPEILHRITSIGSAI
jgi:8-oxo-dGTP pyrophosphatase MutT (NUDIX family)